MFIFPKKSDRKREEEKEMFGYEKTALYLYPRAEYLKEMYRGIAKAKIDTSYKNYDTEKLTEEVVNCLLQERAIEKWRDRTEHILKDFSEEEMCLLEYKYFRRKKMLCGKYREYRFPFSYTSFFRRIRAVTKKFSFRLRGKGFSEKDFLEDFSGSDLIMRVYAKAESGKDECYLRGKDCSFIFASRDQSS